MHDREPFRMLVEPHWELADPAQIRRWGESRRRRRRAAAGGLGVALVCAIGGLVPSTGVMTGPHDGTHHPAARDLVASSSPAWRSDPPSTFDLAAGMDLVDVDEYPGGLARPFGPEGCEPFALAAREAVSSVDAVAGGSGSEDRRALSLYADEISARHALGEVRRSLASCDPRYWGQERLIVVNSPWGSSVDAMVLPGSPARGRGGAPRYVLTAQVGNGVMVAVGRLTSSPDAGGAVPAAVATMVDRMCVFAATPC